MEIINIAAGLTPVKKLKRSLTIFLVLALSFVFLLGLVESGKLDSLLQTLSVFKIEEVRIRSEWPLSPNTVRGWLPTLENTSLLVLRPRGLILSLREKPWVENIAIKKEFPNRVLI